VLTAKPPTNLGHAWSWRDLSRARRCREARRCPMVGEVTRLAYDEARAALREQDATLANVRNRATALLAAAAVGTSFSASAGLLNTDPSRGRVFPLWAAWALLVAVVLISMGVIAVIWPVGAWQFGPSPSKLLSKAEDEPDDVLKGATSAMVQAIAANDRLLDQRMTAYRATVVLLMLEISLLVVALLLARG
jgi:hypothetical protein